MLLSPCELQKGCLSGFKNVWLYTTYHCVEELLVSHPNLPDICLGENKSEKLEFAARRKRLDAGWWWLGMCRHWTLQNFGLSAVQDELKILCTAKDGIFFIAREMNVWNSKGVNGSNVLKMKVSKNIYFWKYENLGAALVGK